MHVSNNNLGLIKALGKIEFCNPQISIAAKYFSLCYTCATSLKCFCHFGMSCVIFFC